MIMAFRGFIITMAFLFLMGCAASPAVRDAGRSEILAELAAKARAIDAYALDEVVDGRRIKRMYFQFEKDGRPFYRFREDLVRGGKPYVYIYNADGKHDIHYFPSENRACRCPTSGAWNPSNYAKARNWHFPYDAAKIQGEIRIGGDVCHILSMRGGRYAVSAATGLPLAKLGPDNDLSRAVVFENMDLHVPDDVFSLPPGVRVVEREKCADCQRPGRAF